MICRDARTGGSLFGFRVSGGGYWVVWNGTALLACLHASCRVVSCAAGPSAYIYGGDVSFSTRTEASSYVLYAQTSSSLGLILVY